MQFRRQVLCLQNKFTEKNVLHIKHFFNKSVVYVKQIL